MPTWKIHDKWSQKLGISEKVSGDVNNLIDAIKNGKTLPKDYVDFVEKESQREANSKKKVVGKYISERTQSHDSARRSDTRGISARIQLKFLGQKGENYVKAWYLHHALDYLDKNRSYINVNSLSMESIKKMYKENKPQTYSEEIMNFLKRHISEVKKDLNFRGVLVQKMEVFFENSKGERRGFIYPEIPTQQVGSIFRGTFDLTNLKPLRNNLNVTAGSVGVDFFNEETKTTSAAIQVRTDIKSGCIDVDVFIREFLPKNYEDYKKTGFHNIPIDQAKEGFVIGFEFNGKKSCSKFSKEDIKNMLNKCKKCNKKC